MAGLKIIWNKKAFETFDKAIEYIFNDSPQAAASVRKEVINAIVDAARNPDRNPPDKHKNFNTNYRAFEIYHYRISYRILKDAIRIVRFRHTSQQPQSY